MSIDLLLTRASTSRLVPPVPDASELETILRAAIRAPDHGALRPWRFVVIQGAGLDRLAELGARCLARRQPDAGEAALDAAREKLKRAPMAIALGGHIDPAHRKIPEIEQVLAIGAGAMNLLNALHGLGYAGKWVTGPNAYDPEFAAGLGFAPPERCYGLIMVGSPDRVEPPPVHDLAAMVRHWS